MSLYSRNNIRRPSDLVGKTVAVSTTGGSGITYLKLCLAELGMTIADVRPINVISGRDRANALVAGVMDAAILGVPEDFIAKQSGFNSMCDLERLNIPAQGQTLSAKRDWISSNRTTALNVLRGFLDAVSFIRTRKEEAKKILAKHLALKDPQLIEHSYNYVVRSQEIKAYPTVEGIAEIVQTLKEANIAAAKQAGPETLVNLSLLKELDTSGFIDELYKGKSTR
jgi:ABC-type nitrate/sulfonate/bicarbonate transport system substrate-binding protein